jgi:hypothetical protein
MPAVRVYKTTVTSTTGTGTLRVYRTSLASSTGFGTLRVYRTEVDTFPGVESVRVYKTTLSSSGPAVGSSGFWVWRASTAEWVEGTPYFWDATAGAWRLL